MRLNNQNEGKMPLVSVIVPVYNVEQYIDRCVDSIVNQTYSSIEIILVDDGSNDKSGMKCDEWALKDNRIKVIHKTNGGLSDARNVGISVANGEWIGFVDSDDYINIRMYELLMNHCALDNVGIIGGKYQEIRNEQEPLQESYQANQRIIPGEELFHAFHNYKVIVNVWTKVYRKDLLIDVKFRKGRLAEDYLFNMEIATIMQKKGLFLLEIPNILVYYTINPDGITCSKSYQMNMQLILNRLEADIIFARAFPVEKRVQQYLGENWLHFFTRLDMFCNPKSELYNNNELKSLYYKVLKQISISDFLLLKKPPRKVMYLQFIIFKYCPFLYRCIYFKKSFK